MTLPKMSDDLDGWPDGWAEQPDQLSRRAAHYEAAYTDVCRKNIRLQASYQILTERFEALAGAHDRLRAEHAAHMAWNGTGDAYDATVRSADPLAREPLTHRYAEPATGESPASTEWFEDPRAAADAAGAESDPAVRESMTTQTN